MDNELFGERHEQEENGLYGKRHEREILGLSSVSNSAFKNGDKVKYAYGLTFVFVGLDPFDNTHAYCVHPTAICQDQPQLKYKRVDKLPIDKLTHFC